MTRSERWEEGLLASEFDVGVGGLWFCPSVNHPAWFAELPQEIDRGLGYYS